MQGSGSTLLASGSGGILLRSTDAGLTWHALRSGVDHWLHGTWLADERNAVIVGQNGLILRGLR